MNGARLLEWDSDFFGLRIAQVESSENRNPDLRAITSECEKENIRCLYFLAESEDFASTSVAEDLGFHLVDIRLRLDLSLQESPNQKILESKFSARLFCEEDLPALQLIAAENHVQSRFFRDPEFPRERVREFYSHWLNLACCEPGSAAFVAEAEGNPVGYLTCKVEPGNTGRIVLAGVDSPYRGFGIGTALVLHAVEWFRSRGLSLCSVVTQGSNIPAQRLYTSNGFYPVRTQLWFHKWFRPDFPGRQ